MKFALDKDGTFIDLFVEHDDGWRIVDFYCGNCQWGMNSELLWGDRGDYFYKLSHIIWMFEAKDFTEARRKATVFIEMMK